MSNLNKLKKSELLEQFKNLNINKSKTKKEIISIIKSKEIIESKEEKEIIEYEKPLIKWVGGKTQIIDKIISNFPNEFDNYHELFIGGGSVLLALLENVEKNKIKVNNSINAYDINETLINMYKNIQNKSDELLLEIKKVINLYNVDESQEKYYYSIRNEFNKLSQDEKNKPKGSAYFIFLNKTCFRGVYREGPNGFNVPFGHYKNPEIINEEHLKRVSKLIRNVNFYHSSFDKSFEKVKENDFIYLDPPYAPENSKSFVGYTSNGFNLEQHKLLFSLCKKYKFLMSNSDVDLVKESFNDSRYTITTILCKRSINSKNPEAKTNEVLIKSY